LKYYDHIASAFSSARRADSRIVATLMSALDVKPGAHIADLGAGTGNYSNALAEGGLLISAIEPSESMIRQAKKHKNVNWYLASAEVLPLYRGSLDGIISVSAIHFFSNLMVASEEMARVCPSGRIVIFTCDPRLSEDFWLSDYFPEMIRERYCTYADIFKMMKIIEGMTSRKGMIIPFPIPHDITDTFAGSGWRRPGLYLDDQVRNSMSEFAITSQDEIDRGLIKLERDIESGEWANKNGYLLEMNDYDLGYRFIVLS
jgi:ubiquinone/menaquinone biosynthesis C-methylase UbiE